MTGTSMHSKLSFLIESNASLMSKASKQERTNYSPLKLSAVHSKINDFIGGVPHLWTPAVLMFWATKPGVQKASNLHVAVHSADTSLFSVSQESGVLTEAREQAQKDKVDGSCGKGLFAYRNFQRVKRETFVCCFFFKYRNPLSFQLRNQIATNTFLDKSFALQSLATGATRKSGSNRFVYHSISHCANLLFNLRNGNNVDNEGQW